MTERKHRTSTLLAAYLAPHPPVLVPPIGGSAHEGEQSVKALNLAAAAIGQLNPETVVIVSPHAPLFRDYIYFYASNPLTGDFASFGHPDVSLSRDMDEELAASIIAELNSRKLAGGYLSKDQLRSHGLDERLDHGVLVPLYFLGAQVPNAKLVALSCADDPPDRAIALGQSIFAAIEETGRRVVLIISGDLSHKVNEDSPYGACPEGSLFDQTLLDILQSGELKRLTQMDPRIRERAAECGFRPILTLIGAFEKCKLNAHVLSYEAPYGIGYGVVSFDMVSELPSMPVQLARRTLEYFLETGKHLKAEQLADLDLNKLYSQKAGVFVSLHQQEDLRGCIGTISATTSSLVTEIMQNAISAATQDPRFDPVQAAELAGLTLNVDVLGPAEPVDDLSQLNPRQYGVIVTQGSRRGLLLPDLDGVDTYQQQLHIACRKAGIDPNSTYQISRFEVTRYT